MKKYNDGTVLLKVVRCRAGLYIIKNLGIMQNATASKEVAQSFLDSWAGKRKMNVMDDLDVDMYQDKQNNNDVCRECISFKQGRCGRQ